MKQKFRFNAGVVDEDEDEEDEDEEEDNDKEKGNKTRLVGRAGVRVTGFDN
jgi:hypothetical protein